MIIGFVFTGDAELARTVPSEDEGFEVDSVLGNRPMMLPAIIHWAIPV
jgi:hypothetical protein